MKNTHPCSALFRVLVSIAFGLASAEGVANAATTRFGLGDGLTHGGTGMSICESPAGKMWFGGVNGLSWFDGVLFENFDTILGRRIRDVSVLHLSGDSTVWVGGSRDTFDLAPRIPLLFAYRNGAWEVPDPPIPWPDTARFVHAIETSPEGSRLWVGTNAGLCVLENHAWTRITTATEPGLASDVINALELDPDGVLWIGTDKGISSLSATGMIRSPEVAEPVKDIVALDGEVFFACTFGGVWVRRPGEGRDLRPLDIPFEGAIRNANAIAAQPAHHRLWFATGEEALGYSTTSRSLIKVPTASGGPDRGQERVFCSSDGAIWFGSYYGAIQRFDGSFWQAVTRPSGGIYDFAVCMAQDPRTNEIWFGTYWGGLYRMNGDRIRNFPRESEFPAVRATDLTFTRSGDVWFAADTQGIGYFSSIDSTFHLLSRVDGLASDTVLCIVEDDSTDALWIGTANGLSRFDLRDSTWQTFRDQLPGLHVSGIVRGSEGALWIVTREGFAARRMGDQWQRVDVGFPTTLNSIFRDGSVYWIATDSGVFFGEPGFWTFNGIGHGLPYGQVTRIGRDAWGRIWVGCRNNGCAVRTEGGAWRALGTSDGLASSDVADLLVDSFGCIWFSGIFGLTRHLPDLVSPRAGFLRAPPALSKDRAQSAIATLAYKEDPARVQFEFLLDGSSVGASPSAAWNADVSDADHTLIVKAWDHSGNIGPFSETARFTVDSDPPHPVINSPGDGDIVKGSVAIIGRLHDPRFTFGEVTLSITGEDDCGGQGGKVEMLLGEFHLPGDPEPDTLLVFDSRVTEDCSYEIVATVVDGLQLIGTTRTRIHIDNNPPFFRQLSPGEVGPGGGDVFSAGGFWRVRFPPGCFESTIRATVDPVPFDQLPPGDQFSQILAKARVGWPDSLSRKAPVLRVRNLRGVPYHDRTLSQWIVFSDGNSLAVPIAILPTDADSIDVSAGHSGEYAVVQGGSAPSINASGEKLAFNPRVMRRSGLDHVSKIAIQFATPRAGSVDVQIHDRAGRLVRELLRGESMPEGAHVVEWDGLDGGGASVLDGIYLVTIRSTSGRTSAWLAVLP